MFFRREVNVPKTIGVLVSGGDCAGLNATVRAITHHATKSFNWRVIGIQRGYWGMWVRPLQTIELTPDVCDHQWVSSGGTFLRSNKNYHAPTFADCGRTFPDLDEAFCNAYNALGLDAIVVIGGDGSFNKLNQIHDFYNKTKKKGDHNEVNFIAIPKTIDNDVAYTDLAIGHETALDVVVEAIDNIQFTAESHDRVMVVEVMGRDAGHIALKAGVASGADAILIPEIPYNINDLAKHIEGVYQSQQRHAIVVVAESVKTPEGEFLRGTIGDEEQTRYRGIGENLASRLKEQISADVRFVSLGHVQRGGRPRIKDRLLASRFGVHAVDLIAKKQFSRVIVVVNGKMADIHISEVANVLQTVDVKGEMVHVAKSLGIYIGDI
ncbi:MAG: ATP-dependent 6-phosphofructokinase [Holosporales bacterium]|nr:ATP-dependent 6-phosphofructokinase [Holosporales bacterium]